jgi:hypothetical protein
MEKKIYLIGKVKFITPAGSTVLLEATNAKPLMVSEEFMNMVIRFCSSGEPEHSNGPGG